MKKANSIKSKSVEEFKKELYQLLDTTSEREIARLIKGLLPCLKIYAAETTEIISQTKYSPLIKAIGLANNELLDFFLAIPDIDVNQVPPISFDSEGITPLKAAIRYNNEYALKKLQQHPKINVNMLNNLLAPIHYFIFHGKIKAFNKFLTDKKVNVNLVSADGLTALICAIQLSKNDFTDILLKHSEIDITSQENTVGSALQSACSRGEAALVEKLLAKQNPDTYIQIESWRLLKFAISSGSFSTVKILMEKMPECLQKEIKTRPTYFSASTFSRNLLHPQQHCVLIKNVFNFQKPTPQEPMLNITEVTPELLRQYLNIDPAIDSAYIRCNNELYYLDIYVMRLYWITLPRKEIAAFDAQLIPTYQPRILTAKELQAIYTFTQCKLPNEIFYEKFQSWVEDNQRILFNACKNGELSIVKQYCNLLETLDFTIQDNGTDFSPLTIAIVNGKTEVVEFLKSMPHCNEDFMAIPTVNSEEIKSEEEDNPQQTAFAILHKAILDNNLEAIKNGIDFTVSNENSVEIPIVNFIDPHGKTMMDYIYEAQRLEIFDLVVQSPLLRLDITNSISHPEFVRCLFFHCYQEQVLLSMLKNPLFDAKKEDEYKNTWLHTAYKQSFLVINELITTHGLDIHTRNVEGYSAFNYICMEGSINLIFEMLVQAKFHSSLEPSDIKILLTRIEKWLQSPVNQREKITFNDQKNVLRWFSKVLLGTPEEPYFDFLFLLLATNEFSQVTCFINIIKALQQEKATPSVLLLLLTDTLRVNYPTLTANIQYSRKANTSSTTTLITYHSDSEKAKANNQELKEPGNFLTETLNINPSDSNLSILGSKMNSSSCW